MRVVKAPEDANLSLDDLLGLEKGCALFLAGSIEEGRAELWQDKVCEELKNEDVIIFNPRRDDWDNSWEQSIDNPEFTKQVEWELKHLELANAAGRLLFYFQPGTKCPITLLELGLHIREANCFVVCPKGFWRKGNVDIVCDQYGVKVYESLDSALDVLRSEIAAGPEED